MRKFPEKKKKEILRNPSFETKIKFFPDSLNQIGQET